MKCAKFFINRNDPAYPKITRFKGYDSADGVSKFHTLGEAKKVLLNELATMKDHYLDLINDTRKLTIKQVDDLSYPHILD